MTNALSKQVTDHLMSLHLPDSPQAANAISVWLTHPDSILFYNEITKQLGVYQVKTFQDEILVTRL